jgi:hypothetical protein
MREWMRGLWCLRRRPAEAGDKGRLSVTTKRNLLRIMLRNSECRR